MIFMTVAVLERAFSKKMASSSLRLIMESDTLIACLLPLTVLLVGFKLFPKMSLSEIRELFSLRRHNSPRNSYFSLERAYHSYSQYARLSADELSLMQASYRTLHRSSKNLGYDIGYPNKLDQLAYVTALNATITDGIAQLAREEFPSLSHQSNVHMVSADLVRVRESLKHFIRDWSEEGASERKRTFSPILDVLKEVDPRKRAGMKILVPGCGLGRLAWEIAELGIHLILFQLSVRLMRIFFRI
jgi:N2227-like protein